MTVIMDITETIFKDGSTFLLWYKLCTNQPLFAGFHNDYITKVVGVFYKLIADYLKKYQSKKEALHEV